MGDNNAKNQVFDVSVNVLQRGNSKFFDDDGRPKRTGGVKVKICGVAQYLNLFGVAIGYTIASSISMILVWRTVFVIITTVISMVLPFFNDVAALLGALGFWPLTVYFPVEMYIAQKKIPRWSTRWVCLQTLSMVCLMISIAATVGSIAGVVEDLKSYKPFQTTY
ncbi:amino acid permease 4-like [Tripterygium wilfordii]|uniref:Amino acid permease 4-like n=1 Tax=Tripterygium wilfordii TaxID=458696 RepID=A0A7J7DSF1_TRIWF|nr:amino acid permease 4-like [Tripterygium wilfordii]